MPQRSGEEGVDARIVAYAVELSQRARSPLFRFLSPSRLYGSGPCPTVAWPQPVLAARCRLRAMGEARVRLMLGGAVLAVQWG